jgi:hypothetical protein
MFIEKDAPPKCPECQVELSADGKTITAISTLLRHVAEHRPSSLYAEGLKRFVRESKCATCKAAGRLPNPQESKKAG